MTDGSSGSLVSIVDGSPLTLVGVGDLKDVDAFLGIGDVRNLFDRSVLILGDLGGMES